MSLLTKQRVKNVVVLSLLAGGTLTACSTPPQDFNELTAETAKEEHLQQLSTWIYPSDEAEKARRAFVERCVAASGGTYKEAVVKQSLETSVYSGRSTEELKKSGYGDLPADPNQSVADFDQKGLDAYLGSKQAEHFEVRFMEYSSGSLAADGCMAQSYEYIYGTVENGVKVALLAPQFGQAIAEELETDQGYIDLQQGWASCMADAGFKTVSSTDQAVYASTLLDKDGGKKMLEADISCRESQNFDATVTELKNSYYESMYKRLKQFSKDFEAIAATAAERVEADKTDPKKTSPVTLPTPRASTSETAAPAAS
ncbi:MAG: hypothetical protein Q3965_04595 [Rothia sp. (in: high G+C Gram-positive bacteria)]|nr:hypothetical protein [Rothia sp. (in: high G+C Gram-positive bacteria)]